MEEESRRFLGFPVGAGEGARPGPFGSFPLGPIDRRWLVALLHPFRAMRAWWRHRRLGPYDIDGDASAK
ncbi:MAG: hypothetical protein KGJ77_09445 [Acidobacteriota bacterium]|nr:hypothetical protein [Acidobacteriota bacterium]